MSHKALAFPRTVKAAGMQFQPTKLVGDSKPIFRAFQGPPKLSGYEPPQQQHAWQRHMALYSCGLWLLWPLFGLSDSGHILTA